MEHRFPLSEIKEEPFLINPNNRVLVLHESPPNIRVDEIWVWARNVGNASTRIDVWIKDGNKARMINSCDLPCGRLVQITPTHILCGPLLKPKQKLSVCCFMADFRIHITGYVNRFS